MLFRLSRKDVASVFRSFNNKLLLKDPAPDEFEQHRDY